MKRLLVVLAALASPLQAQTPIDPAVAFGARENVEFITLSPDGTRVAYAVPRAGQGSRLYWLEVGSTEPHAVTNIDGERQRITGCSWVSNNRLVCGLYAIGQAAGVVGSGSRLVALDLDGGNFRIVGGQTRLLWGGSIIDWLAGHDNEVLMLQAQGTSLAAMRVDTLTGHEAQVEANENAGDFLADDQGRVRIMRVQQRRGATDQPTTGSFTSIAVPALRNGCG